jgi:DNA polymerase sigma
LKKILAFKELNKPFSGGLGSYAVVLMILAYLNAEGENKSISEHLLGFLDFYGNKFNSNEQQICKSYLTGEVVISPTENTEHNHLNIVDPLNPLNNIGKTTYNFPEIQKFFQECH